MAEAAEQAGSRRPPTPVGHRRQPARVRPHPRRSWWPSSLRRGRLCSSTPRPTRRPSGTQVATDVGTATVNGVTMPHVTLHFNTYPDATGSVNGVPIHPAATPAGRRTGRPISTRCRPTPWSPSPSASTTRAASLNNPWFAKVRGTVGGDGHDQRQGGQRRSIRTTSATPSPSGARPGTDPGFFLNVPLPARPRGQPDRQRASTRPSCSASSRGARASTPGTASSRAGHRSPRFGGPMNAYGYMSGFVHVV